MSLQASFFNEIKGQLCSAASGIGGIYVQNFQSKCPSERSLFGLRNGRQHGFHRRK